MDLPAPTAWPEQLRRELEAGQMSGVVGSVLVSETERVRVWHLRIPPGGRCGFHRHVLDYFWTAHNAGRARTYAEDGSVTEHEYTAGETRHMHYAAGEFMVHNVENIGSTELLFTTVEFLEGSANAPLPVPDSVRQREAA